MYKIIFWSILSLLTNIVYANPYLIISPMKIEYLPIAHYIKHGRAGTFNKIPYIKGKIGNKEIVAAYTGIGSINAGIITAILINRFHPRGVILSGVAGSLQTNINYGDVVIATKVFSVNFGQYTIKGASFDGLWPNPIRGIKPPLIYQSSKSYISILKKNQKITPYKLYFGVIASDQHFPFNKEVNSLLTKNKVDAVAMEDIGVAHACWLYQVPMISIRGISDNFVKKIPYTRKRAEIASKHAAFVTYKLIEHF